MFAKFLAATALGAAVILGAAGVSTAAPAPAGGTGTSTGTSTPRARVACVRAPKVLDRIGDLEARAADRLAKLQAAEVKAAQNHHPKRAAVIQKRIERLTKAQDKLTDAQQRIEQRCPNAATGVSPGSTGPSSGPASGSSSSPSVTTTSV